MASFAASSAPLSSSEISSRVRICRYTSTRMTDGYTESETKVEELNAEITTVTQQLDETQNEQLENTRAIMRVQKNAERYLTKRQTLMNRKTECSNAIRDLGVLPEEAFSKYTDTRADKVRASPDRPQCAEYEDF